jgi:hypothetical protein
LPRIRDRGPRTARARPETPGAPSHHVAPPPLDRARLTQYLQGMIRIFDMDDRARLPWRFFGAALAVRARP